MKIANKFLALAIFSACIGNSSAITIDTSYPYSRVVKCNSNDTLDACKAEVHPHLQGELTNTTWKNARLVFKPGNIAAAYDGPTFLGDFPVTLLKVLSIDNRNSPYPGGYKSQGYVEFIAGGIFFTITTTELNLSRQVSVCVNNSCETRTI